MLGGSVVDDLVASRLGGADDAVVSVWLGPPGGAPVLSRRADAVHYAASTMKLPLVIAAYRRHERGELDLDQPVPVHNEFSSAYDGSRFSLDQDDDQDDETWDRIGETATLRVLAHHAIVKSGNLATDLVLEHVGTQEVAAVLLDAGCSPVTKVPRGIEDAPAREAGMDNLVTAGDLALVMGAVAARTIASPTSCREIEGVLAAQEHRDQVPAGLPVGTYVANKTGWVDGVAHDVALVRPETGTEFVLVVCTSADASEETLYALNAAVAGACWEEWRSR